MINNVSRESAECVWVAVACVSYGCVWLQLARQQDAIVNTFVPRQARVRELAFDELGIAEEGDSPYTSSRYPGTVPAGQNPYGVPIGAVGAPYAPEIAYDTSPRSAAFESSRPTAARPLASRAYAAGMEGPPTPVNNPYAPQPTAFSALPPPPAAGGYDSPEYPYAPPSAL